MTSTIPETWAIPGELINQKRGHRTKANRSLIYKHDFGSIIGVDKAHLTEYRPFFFLSGATAETIKLTERNLCIVREDTIVEPHDFAYHHFISEAQGERRYLQGSVKEKLPYYFSILRCKAVVPRTIGDDDIVLSARFPFPRGARTARLTGPIQFLVKLLQTWSLTEEDATTLLGLEATDQPYVSNVFRGNAPLRGRDTKDRIVHLFRIRKTLSALFRDEDEENDWLREPHDLLGGQMPMVLLLEGSMENLLLVKEYVEAAAGR